VTFSFFSANKALKQDKSKPNSGPLCCTYTIYYKKSFLHLALGITPFSTSEAHWKQATAGWIRKQSRDAQLQEKT